MIRRCFLLDGTPLNIERFKNERIMIYKMDDNKVIEYMHGYFYRLIFNDNYIMIDRIKMNGTPQKIINKIRYYIPISQNLDAMIDYCNDDSVSTTVSVDFNTKEEADSFEIPNWFGKELSFEAKYEKKKLKKARTF